MTPRLPENMKRLNRDETRITNILFVGVGGQGIIVASKVLSEVLVSAGLDVKKSEVHGMAQRGGSVVSEVRFGPRVSSPLIRRGACDILISFELLETLRYLDYLQDQSVILVNNQKVLPPSVSMGLEGYPEAIPEKLRKRFKHTLVVDGLQLAQEAGNVRTLSVVLLGALSRHVSIPAHLWEREVQKIFPPPLQQVNLTGFRLGREFAAAVQFP